MRAAADNAVNALGTVTSLENGAGLLDHSAGVSFIPGTTTQQASELSHRPVFEVQGELTDGFLRVAVGDRYVNGRWLPDEEAGYAYSVGSAISGTATTVRPTIEPASRHLNRISVQPVGGEGSIPEGVVPTTSRLETLSVEGTYFPGSDTYATDRDRASYDWISQVPAYSERQLNAAPVAGDYPHSTLPDGVPERVRNLAEEITASHATPYQKAKAIEQYLRDSYAYSWPIHWREAYRAVTTRSIGSCSRAAREPAATSAAPSQSWRGLLACPPGSRRVGLFLAALPLLPPPSSRRCIPTRPTSAPK